MLDFCKSLITVGSLGLIDFDDDSGPSYRSVSRQQQIDYTGFTELYLQNILAIIIRNEFGNDIIPVNPVTIIKKCNLKVIYDKKSWIDYDAATIYVDEKLSLTEQREYMAEALGRYIIRRKMKNPPEPDSMNENIRVGKFARELLLPQSAVINMCYSEKYIDIQKYSKVFGVTEDFFSKRITEINKRINVNLIKIFEAFENTY